MISYLDALSMPASGAWVFGRIPKTGTHSMLAALHQFEFGFPLSTQVTVPGNTSADMAPHVLDEAGVFMSPLQSQHTPETLQNALRFTVIRDPAKRALSSFKYLCQSHAQAARQLAPTRLRMSAMTGFDWDKDIYTGVGLEKMLQFVQESLPIKRFRLDRHIAPQSATFGKDQFRANLTGRTEELPKFLKSLAEALGAKTPRADDVAPRNVSDTPTEFVLTNQLRARIETVFADDMEWYESV